MADAKKRKPKRGKSQAAEQAQAASNGAPYQFHAHLIRIAEKEDMKRAIMVLGEVQIPHCGFADHRLLVVNAHIEALEQAAIPFEYVS